jgi:hypothetical protein
VPVGDEPACLLRSAELGMRRLAPIAAPAAAVWVQLAAVTADLIAWLQLLAVDGDLAEVQPKLLGFRMLHVPARLTRSSRNAGSASPLVGRG